MFSTAVRLFGLRRVPKVPQPHCPRQEAVIWEETLMNILKRHGPLSTMEFWKHAEVEGVRSKRHMKLLLQWLSAQHKIRTVHKSRVNKPGTGYLYSLWYSKPSDALKPELQGTMQPTMYNIHLGTDHENGNESLDDKVAEIGAEQDV